MADSSTSKPDAANANEVKQAKATTKRPRPDGAPPGLPIKIIRHSI